MDSQNPNIRISRDEKNRIRRIDHTLQPFAVKSSTGSTPEGIAARYVKEAFAIKKARSKVITEATRSKRKRTSKNEDELWLSGVKTIRNLAVVEFGQYQNGIKVWKSGVTVLVDAVSGKVLEASSTFDHDLPAVGFNAKKLDKHTATLSDDDVPGLLALDRNKRRLKTIQKDFVRRGLEVREEVLGGKPQFRVTRRDQVIYRYDPDHRKHRPSEAEQTDRNLAERALDLSLPRVHASIKPGSYRVATEVFFTTAIEGLELNWHAVVDYRTGSVLYIRPLIDMLGPTGYVYDRDPLTTTGDTSIVPAAPTEILNGPRNPRPLPTAVLTELSGQYVRLQEICPIISPPPTSASGKFDYDADTDDFAAVNAYYQSDLVFRMVEEMGFDMSSYFDGTSFPVPVDHRGSSACVNAAAWGNPDNDGLGSFTFGLVEAGQPVGIAADLRVVLHEFGHAILWDHVNDPNFGFAHSCGDSLAAVLCDPGSKAPDRFLTFPWVAAIPRRHDRDVAAGWAWGGVNDTGSYDSEQILSTSHFRAYRSMGGDHPDICEQQWAARYLAYLMIHAVGTLTPVTNPDNPEDWSDRLQLCDLVTSVLEGHPGGAVHKVIRWAFEKQGAYQAAGAPTPVTTAGSPPAVDVYINDGRNGEYDFTRDWCRTGDIWNRICADGYPAHQAPISGVENHAYVIVRNRGTQTAPGGLVRAFHRRDDACCDCCDDCSELTWPDDFMPMITAELSHDAIPAGDYQIVGPFVWKPKRGDCILMIAEAEGDASNVSLITPGQSLLTRRLVPLDNNIALRCTCKQCNPDYSRLGDPCRGPVES